VLEAQAALTPALDQTAEGGKLGSKAQKTFSKKLAVKMLVMYTASSRNSKAGVSIYQRVGEVRLD
jgi:hypothetical protein